MDDESGRVSLPRAAVIRVVKSALQNTPYSQRIEPEVSDAFNASVDNFVKDLTRRACQASEEVGAKKSKLMKIDHDHVLAALEGMGAGHLCEDVREVALQEEAADRANVKRKKKAKLTPEEEAALIEEQEQLLEQSKKSMQG